MELLELKNKIISSFSGKAEELNYILQIVEQDKSIFPFNEYEHLLHYLMNAKGVTFEQYLEIRNEYLNENPYLWIFEISAPRGFGESFAQTHINGMCRELKKPSKKLDPHYSGEYDFWLDGIKLKLKRHVLSIKTVMSRFI